MHQGTCIHQTTEIKRTKTTPFRHRKLSFNSRLLSWKITRDTITFIMNTDIHFFSSSSRVKSKFKKLPLSNDCIQYTKFLQKKGGGGEKEIQISRMAHGKDFQHKMSYASF